jgi:Putative adhesin
MQSQEGIPGEQAASAERSANLDPREQRPAPQGQQTYAECPYEERPYTEGYGGIDADESWARPGEKIYPKTAGQRGIEGPLLFIILLCALIATGMLLGIMMAWLSWLLLAVFLVAGLFVVAMNWRVVTIPLPLQTFQVQDHPQLTIQDSTGLISIRRGADNVVTVAATKRVSGIGMTPENMLVQYALQDNRLNISGLTIWNLLQFGIRHLDLVITVPEGCDIQLSNGSGDVTVQGVSGRIDLRTGSGPISVSEVNGQISLKTGSGPIGVSEVNGQISLKTGSGPVSGTGINGQLKLLTGSGRIDLEQAALKGSSQIKTGSGAITFTGELDPYGNYNLVTGSGRVNLTLPTNAAFRLNAATGSGGVLNDFGNIDSDVQPRAQLRVKSGSGTIHVQRGESWRSSL